MAVKRTIGLITAMFFILNALFAVPVSAASGAAVSEAAIQISDPVTGNTPDSAVMSASASTNFTGAVSDTDGTSANTTGAAFNTTGTAIDSAASGSASGTTSAAIGSASTGAAIAAESAGTASGTAVTSINTSGAAIGTTGSAVNAAGSALTTTPKAVELEKNDESMWYLPQIPMKKEHQKLLWDYCKKRGIDYIDMLALISVESNFYEKCSSGSCKGYFQINAKHGKNLAATLKTANKPLDGAININWGTAMYSWILADKRVKGLTGKKLRDVALSIYQRGTGGYDRYGINKSYLAKYYKKRDIIISYFEENKENEAKDRSE